MVIIPVATPNYIVYRHTAALQEDIDFTIANLRDFCFSLDNEFHSLLQKLINTKLTMETMFFLDVKKTKVTPKDNIKAVAH